MKNRRRILFIFNLELDLESKVLAIAHDWVEEFSKSFSRVHVISTHVGTTSLPINVTYSEIGGGNLLKRIRAIFRLLRLIPTIVSSRHELMVFHHMSPRTALIIGPLFRLLKIPQGLWYSHSHKSQELALAVHIVDKLFSSTPDALPVSSRKSEFTGHGIPTKKFIEWRIKTEEARSIPMISIGRLAPIKRFESGIQLVSKLGRANKEMLIVGPVGKLDNYPKTLSDYAQTLDVKLEFLGPKTYKEIPNLLSRAKYFYSGTPQSVDKAAIEAALSGVFVLSENRNTMQLCGMDSILSLLGYEVGESLQKIVEGIEHLQPSQITHARKEVSLAAEKLSDLQNTCALIVESLQEVENS